MTFSRVPLSLLAAHQSFLPSHGPLFVSVRDSINRDVHLLCFGFSLCPFADPGPLSSESERERVAFVCI